MNTYLLEKSRITSQLADEQNYHVMYMVAGCLPDKVRRAYEMPAWEQFSYLNVRDKKKVEWEEFPTTFKELEDAMATIPTVKPYAETAWKILAAILHLGNAKFKGSGEDDAIFDSGPSLGIVSRLLGCETEQLNKAVCTLNIKAGLDWIAKPNTTTYAQSAKDALSKALYSRLFDKLVENINESLMFGGDTRFFIGAVDIFGFECFPRNSLEQLCINFANEKLQRMFTEAVFESVLAEYTKEGIDIGGMTYEDNSAVVSLIEGSPNGLLTLLSEECFFPNGSDNGWLGKIKEAHRKNAQFEGHVKESKTSFTVLHYPGRVSYDAIGFLEKNKDPLSQDVKVLMQYSDDEFVSALFTDKVAPGGRSQFKSAKFVGVIDSFRTSLTELVKTLKATKTHFIRCVKPNEKKAANMYVHDVMKRQLYTSGVVQAVKATRKGFPDHLVFEELLGRYALILGADDSIKGRKGCALLLEKAKVPESKYRLGKTKVFLGVGMLDMLEQSRMEYIAKKAVSMQMVARAFLARKELRRRIAERERKKKEEEERKAKEEEEKRRKEEEERKIREEAERVQMEAEKKAKEAEEKDRQERFRRARQLSFERKTAKKKREEAEKKRAVEEQAAAEAEAAAQVAMVGAVNAARQSFGELPIERAESSSVVSPNKGLTENAQENFASKLQSFQQDVADGTVADSEMMNVAVVSDIGWKTGQEPTSEDVWAQYDFKCAVSDVLEYAEYLGMDIKEDAHLLWIADEALQAPEPQGWEQRLDPKGGVYYYHPTTGMSLNQHPLDHHYQQFYMQMKAQYDAMYQNNRPTAPALPEVAQGPSETPSTPSGLAPIDNSAMLEKSKSKKGLFGGLLGKKAAGPTEEMFQLTVDLLRQQDGLGIGLTLDNIIVEVEPGGSVAAQGDLRYGDQIVQVDGVPLSGRMLKDVIVPRKMHQLVVRYSRVSTQPSSPRRARSRRIEGDPNSAPRRIEEIDLTITRESGTGRLGFGIDQMNTVVEVDPKGPVATKLQVGDKIVAVDGELLNFRKFVEVVGPSVNLNLRIARLRAAHSSAHSKSKREQLFGQSRKQKKKNELRAATEVAQGAVAGAANAGKPSKAAMPALREVKLVKETEDTKIGAVFHRLDDAFDKSFFNVEGSSVQPIIKKVDPGSMAEMGGLVPGDIVLSVNGVSGLSNFQVRALARTPTHRALSNARVRLLDRPLSGGGDAAQGAGGLYVGRDLWTAGELFAQAAVAAAADDAVVTAARTTDPQCWVGDWPGEPQTADGAHTTRRDHRRRAHKLRRVQATRGTYSRRTMAC